MTLLDKQALWIAFVPLAALAVHWYTIRKGKK